MASTFFGRHTKPGRRFQAGGRDTYRVCLCGGLSMLAARVRLDCDDYRSLGIYAQLAPSLLDGHQAIRAMRVVFYVA